MQKVKKGGNWRWPEVFVWHTLPWFWLGAGLLSPAEFPRLGHVHSWLHSAGGSAHPGEGTNTHICMKCRHESCFDKRANCKVIATRKRRKSLTLVLASIWAPRSNSRATMLVLPLLEATWRGVIPFWKGKRNKGKLTLSQIWFSLQGKNAIHGCDWELNIL